MKSLCAVYQSFHLSPALVVDRRHAITKKSPVHQPPVHDDVLLHLRRHQLAVVLAVRRRHPEDASPARPLALEDADARAGEGYRVVRAVADDTAGGQPRNVVGGRRCRA